VTRRDPRAPREGRDSTLPALASRKTFDLIVEASAKTDFHFSAEFFSSCRAEEGRVIREPN
jgi:hypothetical protein